MPIEVKFLANLSLGLLKKVEFGLKSTSKSIFSDCKVNFGGQKVDLSRYKRLSGCLILKGPALHESNFAVYFTGCQLLRPEKSVRVNFRGRKVDFKYCFSNLICTHLMFLSTQKQHRTKVEKLFSTSLFITKAPY